MSRMQPTTSKLRSSGGFTVMELMIATLVFGVALLGVTTAVMQFSRVYYKGVTEANTQTAARTIVDLISQSIQFGGGTNVVNAPSVVCAGNKQFSYNLGVKVEDGPPAQHGLVMKQASSCNLATPPDFASGQELLSPQMRLVILKVENVSTDPKYLQLYRVQVKIAYGDDDLLGSQASPGNPAAPDVVCKSAAGSEFCAISHINTIVVKRVNKD